MTSDTLNPWLLYGLLIAIGISGGLGDIWIYKWSRTGSAWWFAIACGVWLISLLLFAFLLKLDDRSFSASFILSSISHVVLVIVCDLAYFGGRLSRLEWAGITLAVVSIVLLEMGRDRSADPKSEDSSTDSNNALVLRKERE